MQALAHDTAMVWPRRVAAGRRAAVAPTKGAAVAPTKGAGLATRGHQCIKRAILDFRPMPADRFTESEVASHLQVSRPPLCEALTRRTRKAVSQVMFRGGWRVRPIDYQMFENLYDVPVVLELAAVRRLCERPEQASLAELKSIWLLGPHERMADRRAVAAAHEGFHATLVAATGNLEMARIHHEVTE